MAPSRSACEILVKTNVSIHKILTTIQENRQKINKAAEIESRAQFGNMLDKVLDIGMAELVSAIGAAATSVANGIIGPVSKMGSSLVEAIMVQILNILLTSPTAVFSMVSVPHKAALKALSEERKYLSQANNSLMIVLALLDKWSIRFSNAEYYSQIKGAIPNLDKAIKLIQELIVGLSKPNASFDESAYASVLANIDQALLITKPNSVINNALEISSRIESDSKNRFATAKRIIDNKYIQKINDLKSWYISSELIPNIKVRYDQSNALLLAEWDEELGAAEIKAHRDAIVNITKPSGYNKNMKGDFFFDMMMLTQELTSVYEGFTKAFIRYKESQVLCNTIYDIKGFVNRLITELIKILRATGNVAGKTMIQPLDSASTLLEVTKDLFDEVDIKEPCTSMASKIVAGYGMIESADKILHTTITKSLISLVNADEELSAGNDEFNEFIKTLNSIPDWDSKVGAWAVDAKLSKLSPYMQLVADSFGLIGRALVDKDGVYDAAMKMQSDLERVLLHNRIVDDALRSYTPYTTTDTGNLEKLLSDSGLLDSFAAALSVTAVVSSIVSSVVKGGFDESIPNLKNCAREYGDLFEGDEARSFALSGSNIRPSHYDSSKVQKIEDNMYALYGTKKAVESISLPRLMNKGLLTRTP